MLFIQQIQKTVYKMSDTIYNSILFDGINQADADMILDCLRAVTKKYARGTAVIKPGDETGIFGIVTSGQMQIIKDDYWGNRTIISSLSESDMFGEASCCPVNELAPFSVVAVTDASAVLIRHENLFSSGKLSCDFHNTLLYNFTRSLAAKNNTLSRKISHITERSTRDKLMSYLSEQAHVCGHNSFKIPFNRQELADYLSVDRSAMSAELSKMRREGIIDYTKNSFKIL